MYKYNQAWPYPAPIEEVSKKWADSFYKEGQAHNLQEHQQWGKVQPAMNPAQDPGAHNRQYRTNMAANYFWRQPHKWFGWAQVVGDGSNKGWMKKDARDRSKMNPLRYYNGGQIDYRDQKTLRTHEFLIADNWKPITAEEEIAMKERLEILGRNRRYFWKMKFHPKYENYFSFTASDAAYTRWNRINSQFWYVFNVRKDRRDVIRHASIIYVIPFAVSAALWYGWWGNGNTRYGQRVAPVVPKYGMSPQEYGYGDNITPKNALIRGSAEPTPGFNLTAILGFLCTSFADKYEHIQFDIYKRNKAYGKGEPQPAEWPKRPTDWDRNAEAYWNTPQARHAGSGFDPTSEFWKDGGSLD